MPMNVRPQTSLVAAMFYYIVIAFSALLILFPALREPLVSKALFAIFGIGFFVLFVLGQRRRGTLHMTVGQIHEESKKGARLTPPGIEVAAFVILAVVFYWR